MLVCNFTKTSQGASELLGKDRRPKDVQGLPRPLFIFLNPLAKVIRRKKLRDACFLVNLSIDVKVNPNAKKKDGRTYIMRPPISLFKSAASCPPSSFLLGKD